MELMRKVKKWLKDTSKTLDISFCSLKKWPDVLKGKEDLIVKLDCSYNKLTSLPLHLPNLTELECSNNRLKVLPLCPKLTGFDCNDNQLTSLPLHLPNIVTLGCFNNQLT